MSGEIEKPYEKETILIGDCIINLKNYKRLEFNKKIDKDVDFAYCFCGSQGSDIETKETVRKGIKKAKFSKPASKDYIEILLSNIIAKYSVDKDADISVVVDEGMMGVHISGNNLDINLIEKIDG